MTMKWFGLVLLQLLAKTVCSSDSNPDGKALNIYNSFPYEYLFFFLGNVKETLYLRSFILIWRTVLLITIP